ncbi:MAG: alpha-ribazole phosphatase family protein [Gammaproteobacteria bacterium]|nr:alpha-ribazole phosphatase family protein [Gammaproteobacteria bacterium]
MVEVETTIDLIRHGEPRGGVKIRGSLDDPLSETGWSQMWSAVGQEHPWQEIVSSPLSRCSEFAGQLGQKMGVEVHRDDRLREIGFGAWEGADPKALYATVPEAVNNFWADPGAHPPPGGEPFKLFQQRVLEALESLGETYHGRHVLVVAHGGVIRMLVARVLGMPPENLFRMEIPYAATSRIRIQDDIARIAFLCGRF